MSAKPPYHDWLRECKRIAVEKYEFCAGRAESYFTPSRTWAWYWVHGYNPEDAIKANQHKKDK